MHDTWNPWHGCKKISEGCANCYMYFLDQIRAQDSTLILLTNNMKKPLAKNRKGEYKIKSGELIRVCMTSDFFLEEADAWRTQAWDIMRIRSDVKLQHQGRKHKYILVDQFNNHIPEEQRYQRQFDIDCTECGSKLICNGIELG